MKNYNLYKFTHIILIVLAIASYFFGFYFDENSAGAGGYDGDFQHIYNNLKIFLNNDLATSISHSDYLDSRPPTSYILHELLNPFVLDEINFRRSVFIISLSIPVLFYFCLKKKFRDYENLVLILISCTIFLSPYFRTTAYWGLQENYGYIFLLLTFLSLSFLDKENNNFKFNIYFKLLTLIFFSSACIYFDQKLLIIPIICFLKIILSKIPMQFKIFSSFCYFIFSLPYVYLISIWGSLIPTTASESRKLGQSLHLEHLGYGTTMIAFYLLPLLFFKKDKIISLIKNLLSDKKNNVLIIFFILYLIYLSLFFNFNKELILGYGFIHKISILIFNDYFIRSIFVYFSFIISWLIIITYINKSFKDYLILGYFLLLSIIIWPIFQEYFDPLIIILAFTFFSSKIYISYKNSVILFAYLLILLISTNVYYSGWINQY